MKLLLFLLLFLFTFSTVANAEETTTITPTTSSIKPTKPLLFPTKREIVEEKNDAMMQAKLTFENKIQEAREERIEKFKEIRETFKEKLQLLKDERKKALVTRIDAKLAMINQNRTDKMAKSLDRMTELLTKLSSKSATLKLDGKDTSLVETAITEAQTAIAAAKEAVAAQAGKDYTAAIEDENSLKNIIGKTFSGLQEDLKAVHETVKTAKKETMDVVREIAKLLGE